MCDLDCDTERHLFDGFDCMDELPKCQEMYQDFCAGRFANGICDESCNSEACFWDGGDCITEQIKFVDDTLVLYLSDWSTSDTNAIDLKELGRSLSKLLRTIVRILPDEVENDLAEYQAARTSNRRSLNKRSPGEVDNIQADDKESQSKRLTRDTNSVYETNQRLRIKLDNTKCKDKCFKKVSKAAEFIYLSLQKGWDPGMPISAIAGKSIKIQLYSVNTLNTAFVSYIVNRMWSKLPQNKHNFCEELKIQKLFVKVCPQIGQCAINNVGSTISHTRRKGESNVFSLVSIRPRGGRGGVLIQ